MGQIQLLESELQSQKENSGLNSLEVENSNLMQERDSILQRLAETEKLCEQQRSQYDMMMKKCKLLVLMCSLKKKLI